MGGAIPKERWGKSINYEVQPRNQQSFIYRDLEIDEDFPTWLQEMYQKYGPYNSPEKLEFNNDQQCEQEQDDEYFFKGFKLNEQMHGYGVMLKDQKFYEGSFKYDKKQGWGRQLEPNLLMEGYWENNQIVRDLIKIQGDEKYQGQFQNDIPHGKGIMIFEKEDEIYDGDFENGIRNGKGIMKNVKYNCQYDGDFQNNKMQGKGIFQFGNGMEYEGEFYNNEIHGKGYLKFPDGRFYKGYFCNNKLHGMGILKESNAIYDGEFQNGQKHGYGKMYVNKFEIVGRWVEDIFKEEQE